MEMQENHAKTKETHEINAKTILLFEKFKIQIDSEVNN